MNMKSSHTARRARTADPSTSQAAAQGSTPEAMTSTQRRVLTCFRLHGDMTDSDLARMLNVVERDSGMTKFTSPSGARSRRKELSRANEERLRELRSDWYRDHGIAWSGQGVISEANEVALPVVQRQAAAEWARRTLLIEGVRSPLWPTGKTQRLSTGYSAIVWGMAE